MSFILNMPLNYLDAFVYVVKVKDIFLLFGESFESHHIIPGMANFSSIHCDVSERSLNQFDPGSMVEGRMGMGKKGKEAFRWVAQAVKPYEGVIGFSVGEGDGAILNVSINFWDFSDSFHSYIRIIMAIMQ